MLKTISFHWEGMRIGTNSMASARQKRLSNLQVTYLQDLAIRKPVMNTMGVNETRDTTLEMQKIDQNRSTLFQASSHGYSSGRNLADGLRTTQKRKRVTGTSPRM